MLVVLVVVLVVESSVGCVVGSAGDSVLSDWPGSLPVPECALWALAVILARWVTASYRIGLGPAPFCRFTGRVSGGLSSLIQYQYG